LTLSHLAVFFEALVSCKLLNGLDMSSKVKLMEFMTSIAHRAEYIQSAAAEWFSDFVCMLVDGMRKMPHRDSLPSIFKRYVIKHPRMWYPLLARLKNDVMAGSLLEFVSMESPTATAQVVAVALRDIGPQIELWAKKLNFTQSSGHIIGAFELLHACVAGQHYDSLMQVRVELAKMGSALPSAESLVAHIRDLVLDVDKKCTGPRGIAVGALLKIWGAVIALLVPDFTSQTGMEIVLSAASTYTSLLCNGADVIVEGGKEYSVSGHVIAGIECLTKPICFEDSLLIKVGNTILGPLQDQDMNILMKATKATIPRESTVATDQLEAVTASVEESISAFLDTPPNDMNSIGSLTMKLIMMPERRLSSFQYYDSMADAIATKIARFAAKFSSLGSGHMAVHMATIYSYMISIMFIHFPEKMAAAVERETAIDEIIRWASGPRGSASFTLMGSLVKDCGQLMQQSDIEAFIDRQCLPGLKVLKGVKSCGQDEPDEYHSSMSAYTVVGTYERFPAVVAPLWDELATDIATFRCDAREFSANMFVLSFYPFIRIFCCI
jgi:hypothetical protein